MERPQSSIFKRLLMDIFHSHFYPRFFTQYELPWIKSVYWDQHWTSSSPFMNFHLSVCPCFPGPSPLRNPFIQILHLIGFSDFWDRFYISEYSRLQGWFRIQSGFFPTYFTLPSPSCTSSCLQPNYVHRKPSLGILIWSTTIKNKVKIK